MTKKELYATAKTLNIRGRSKMNKAELQRAIEVTLGEPINQPEEATMDSKQMLVSLTQDMNLKFDNGERVNIVEMRAPRDEMDVLFNDPSPRLFEDQNLEAEFNEMLELQGDMALIRYAANQLKRDVFKARKEEYKTKMQAEYALRRAEALSSVCSPWLDKLDRNLTRWKNLPAGQKSKTYKAMTTWKRAFWAKWGSKVAEMKAAWKEFKELKAKEKAAKAKVRAEWDRFEDVRDANEDLWEQWHMEQAKCSDLTKNSSAGHGRLWGEYFNLVNDEDYLLFVQLDPEDIDDQSLLMDPIETQFCLRDTHLADPFSKPDHYEEEKTEELPVRTYGYVAPVRDVTSEYKAEADLEAEWNELNERFMDMLDEEELSYLDRT